MQIVQLTTVLLLACTSASFKVESMVGYHEKIGIPTASRIKAIEDAILTNKNSTSRIVGGSLARPHNHPYLAGLLITFANYEGTSVCSSSLISINRLVTAAHCWTDGIIQASRLVVVLGSDFLFYGGDRYTTSKVAVHPNWDAAVLQNDVAVIYLMNRVTFKRIIQPIALPRDLKDDFRGEWAVAAGFGKTSDAETGITVNALVNQVRLQVMSFEQCQAVFGHVVQRSNVCTSGACGVGICNGDSGGPLVVTRGGQTVLIGISSFGVDAGCELGFPSAFARVTSYYNFITQHLRLSSHE